MGKAAPLHWILALLVASGQLSYCWHLHAQKLQSFGCPSADTRSIWVQCWMLQFECVVPYR